jgi:hypothetical protein
MNANCNVIPHPSSLVSKRPRCGTFSPHPRRSQLNGERPVVRQPQGLVDILDKILDKGLVVAGDVRVSLANVELLTIQLRLVICSVDKAEAIGINWWRSDRFYSASAERALPSAEEFDALKARIHDLENQLARTTAAGKPGERKGR